MVLCVWSFLNSRSAVRVLRVHARSRGKKQGFLSLSRVSKFFLGKQQPFRDTFLVESCAVWSRNERRDIKFCHFWGQFTLKCEWFGRAETVKKWSRDKQLRVYAKKRSSNAFLLVFSEGAKSSAGESAGGDRALISRRSSAYFEAEKKANFRVDEATVFADFNGRTIGECVLSAWHVFWDILEVLKRPQIGRIRKDIASEIGTSSIRQIIILPPSKREKQARLYSSGVIFWSFLMLILAVSARLGM